LASIIIAVGVFSLGLIIQEFPVTMAKGNIFPLQLVSRITVLSFRYTLPRVESWQGNWNFTNKYYYEDMESKDFCVLTELFRRIHQAARGVYRYPYSWTRSSAHP
jgi:hypothetical protein